MTEKIDLTIHKILDEESREAHRQYLETWSIMTLVAENDGAWNETIQHRVITNMQNMATTMQTLTAALADFLVKTNQTDIQYGEDPK